MGLGQPDRLVADAAAGVEDAHARRGLDRVAQRCLDGLDAGEPVGLLPKARSVFPLPWPEDFDA